MATYLQVTQVSNDGHVAFEYPEEFILPLIGALLSIWVAVLTTCCIVMPARTEVYPRTYMSDFDEQHREAFPGEDKAGWYGYPDCGNGLYSKQLSYAHWYKMANAQRVQENLFGIVGGGGLPGVLLLTLIPALRFPRTAFGLQIGCALGRVAYSIGHVKYGPSGRKLGQRVLDVSILAALILSGYTVVAMVMEAYS